MNAVKPLMGLPNGASPLMGLSNGANSQTAGQILAAAPVTAFSSVLTNLLNLLQGLFQGGVGQPADIKVSQDSSLKVGKPQDVNAAPSDAPKAAPAPDQRTDISSDKGREDLRKEIERHLDQLPYDQMPVQIDAIRQVLQQLDTKRGVDEAPARNVGQVMKDIVQALQDSGLKSGINLNLKQPEAPAQSAAEPGITLDLAAKKIFAQALDRAPEAPAAPAAPNAAPVLKPVSAPALKSILRQDVLSTAPDPLRMPPPPPPSSPPSPTLTVPDMPAPVAVEHPAAPAPSLTQVPVNGLTASMTVTEVEVSSTEPAGPLRTDVSVRGIGTADVRRSEVFSSSARAAQSETAAPDTDRVEFIERLMRAAKLTQAKGQAHLKMVLNPPRLGSLKVDLAMRDRVLNGTLKAETESAKDMILSNLNTLKDSLKDQGIRVGSLTVGVDHGFEKAQRDFDRGAPKESHVPRPSAIESHRSETPGESVARLRSARLQLIDVMA